MNQWQKRDVALIWHPCSQMKDYETLPPVVVDHAKGVWLYDQEGKAYLDIVSSWWANLLGHGNPVINARIKEQLEKLEHVIFANFTHEPAITLAERLLPMLPKGLCKFHFNDNGSSAVEAALKMVFQYSLQTGHGEKKRFMCLSNGYHGETIGALSVGSLDLFARLYKPMMMDNIHVKAPDCFRCPFGRHREDCSCECFSYAEEAFAKHGRETCAIIVEPILQGSAGMRIYPAQYLKKLRALCNAYDVKLIADEIATGFGRTGKMFACQHAGITPDVMTVSKGLTGGYMPMSITITTKEIYDAFYGDYLEYRTFVHSHTYAGNPLGCAAAHGVLDVMEQDHILEKAARTAKWLTERMNESFGQHPNVGEIRHIGLIHAMELIKDKKGKVPFDPRRRIGYEIYKRALAKGLVLRPLGDVLYFNPPLTIQKNELEKAIAVTRKAMDEVLA
jgi:adenosylmethionine-8-amino-7-oxononanoate aminotransferase